MPPSIRELKRNYKVQLALGRTLPTHDLAVPLPLSTGNPLYDGALVDKLVPTRTLNEAEHLARAWQLVRGASEAERGTLARHGRGLLNDYKLLLALRCWEAGDGEGTRRFLRALPWGWRLGFPTAVIKPSARIFTGWRRSLRFRLVDDPRFPELKELTREIMAGAPPVALLKYRAAVHEATALLHYRFDGERERALHQWCYASGDALAVVEELEPIPTYVRARQALRTGGPAAFLDVLESSSAEIPITSFMGLLGSYDLRLTEDRTPEVERLRAYAVRCATAVEALLRLAEWGPWLRDDHVEVLAKRVREAVIEAGLALPFFKVVKAFLAAPLRVRKRVLQPLFLPLLRHFGQQAAGLLPPPGPLTYVQPGNIIHAMSFLLYAALASATETRLLLLYRDGVEEVGPLPLDQVGGHLADGPQEFETWLLEEFGGLATRYEYTYNMRCLTRALKGLDPQAALVLDLPFAQEMDLLAALLPFERVFNMNGALGAPGELCLATQYYADLFFCTRRGSYGVWSRYSDRAATQFTELLDRLAMFGTLAEADGEGTV